MNNHLLLEAAFRSLVMGAMVFVVLRVMRIDHVRARRTAWLLALAGALAMPALVGAHIGPRLLPDIGPSWPQVAGMPAEPHIPALSEAPNRGDVAHRRPLILDEERAPHAGLTGTLWSLALFGYCTVAAVLLLRLCAGVGLAQRLRAQGRRVILTFDPDLDVRVSLRIPTPVTVGSTVLLPGSHTSWDGATLRVVLSHERAHVRQKDFYVHALAGLNCALFWFNPFSWWLKRQLAELGEALSDCAAVEQAESRASYAEILLAFATHDRLPGAGVPGAGVPGAGVPGAGVPMAGASNLVPRIERLLSDHRFERSFAAKRRLPYLAAGVVMLAMAAATSMVRVQAAQPVEPDEAADDPHEDGVMVINADHAHTQFDTGSRLPSHRGDYIYFQYQGKPYLIQDPAIIAQAQAMLAPMKVLTEQQKELGRKQHELALEQSTLRAQQAALVSAQAHAAGIDTPEFKRDMAELKNVVKDMHLDEITAEIDRNALAEVQSHLAEIQAATGKLTADLAMQGADLAAHQGALGESQGQLGEQQGRLGEQQARLGEQQSKIAEQVRRQLKPIIEQAIREGKGTAVTEP